VVFTLPCIDGNIGYSVEPLHGYYDDQGAQTNFTNILNGRWHPWDPVIDIKLKKIGNPIALYAKKFNARKPDRGLLVGQPIGYDLMKGDWVAPSGKGETADLIFRLDRTLGGIAENNAQIYDATLTVSFSREGDGIQSIFADPFKGSQLFMPRFAPENGYGTNMICRSYIRQDGSRGGRTRSDQNYFFRVRTKKDNNGKIISTLYGKIHGEIEWDWQGRIKFAYYLNPTPNDRNMEFDSQRNLFGRLPSLERAYGP
jgi:hypothetical protein